MPRPTHLLLDDDVERREIALNATSLHSYTPSTCYSSNPTSPAPSLFSKHQCYASSASSLSVSPTVATTYTDPFGVLKKHLTDVKEEPHDAEMAIRKYTADYSTTSQEYYEPTIPDGSVGELSIDPSNRVVLRRRQSDTDSMRMFRLSRPYSSTSSLRKVGRASSPPLPPPPPYHARPPLSERPAILQRPSIAGSLSSLAGGQSLYGCGNSNPAESHEREVGREKRKDDATLGDELERERTPLLPPIITKLDEPEPLEVFPPLQSPSVVSMTQLSRSVPQRVMMPMSRRPSGSQTTILSSATKSPYLRHPSGGYNHGRRVAPEQPPIAMPECEDEWSLELGHANFIIHPRPYMPEVNTIEAIEAHFADWQTARSNYAKHLARVSKFYGQTSSIYQLTEKKWASIEEKWKVTHDRCVSRRLELEASMTATATARVGGIEQYLAAAAHEPLDRRNVGKHPRTLSQFQNYQMGGSVKIPTINDSKFPDLGDEDIIGLMTVDKPRSQTAFAAQSRLSPSETSSSSLRGTRFLHSLMNAFRLHRSR
ncbi:hypothetical protein KEM54_005361 [Ascosphaera aggregata]|nr:hypothetical protein KEM54_005361 [Ascosphaera aggregata]